MAKRRGAGSRVSCTEGAQHWSCCVSPLYPQSLTSVWLFSLLPLPVLPSEHHLVAFSSATREGDDGGHQQERSRLSDTRRLLGDGVGGKNENQDFLLTMTLRG